jgi:hypothetical protein
MAAMEFDSKKGSRIQVDKSKPSKSMLARIFPYTGSEFE